MTIEVFALRFSGCNDVHFPPINSSIKLKVPIRYFLQMYSPPPIWLLAFQVGMIALYFIGTSNCLNFFECIIFFFIMLLPFLATSSIGGTSYLMQFTYLDQKDNVSHLHRHLYYFYSIFSSLFLFEACLVDILRSPNINIRQQLTVLQMFAQS